MTDYDTAVAIADQLRSAESSTDRAIASIAAATAALATARADCADLTKLRNHGLASQEQLLRLGKLQAALIEKRSDLYRLHGGMRDFGRELMGPDATEDCPERHFMPLGELRVVGG